MEILNNFLDFEILRIGAHVFRVYNVLYILFILAITKFILWISKKAVNRSSRFDEYDQGNIYALFQILTYVIWIISFTVILETIGIKMNVLLAGSAALLVGVGLGLQQTFNDIISGIILLFEGTTKVGDILEVDGDVIKIQNIGLRTSKAINRDQIVAIIPNSQITTSKVVNWSHQTKKTRFHISVGVAYGTDVDKALQLLEESVIAHPQLNEKDFIEARFIDFGASSLDLEVLFLSENTFQIERIKSDIRKIINGKFVENNITIPFQQVDLHIKSNKFGAENAN